MAPLLAITAAWGLVVSARLDRLLHHAEIRVITCTPFRPQGRLQLEQAVLIAQQALS
jgi:hypothetical protein